MPHSAYTLLIKNGNPIAGPVAVHGMQGLWLAHEFQHRIYHPESITGSMSELAAFTPAILCLDYGAFIPELYRVIVRGEKLDRVELHFPHYNKKIGKEEIALSMIMRPALIAALGFEMANVKDRRFERYGHLARLEFHYHWMEVVWHKGYHLVKIEWPEIFSGGFFLKDKYDQKEFERIMKAPALTDSMEAPLTRELVLAGISITGPGWEHTDETLKAEKEAAPGRTIRLLADVDGATEGEAMRFEIMYTTPKGSTAQFSQASGTIKNNTATAEWKIDTSKIKEPEYKVHFEPVVRGKYGPKREIPLKKRELLILWVIDCHMHINSGHCAPVPLSKSKVPLPFMNQKRLDTLGSINIGPLGLGDFGRIQKLPTDEIGKMAVAASQEILSTSTLNCLGEPLKRRRLIVNLPMNMDFAHLRGYEGKPIYENIDGKMVWWNERKGRFIDVSSEDLRLWENYSNQLGRINSVFFSSKGSFITFIHYDPRANLKNWYAPFNKYLIQTASPDSFPQNAPAIGIKMYTALGYRPNDSKLKFPWDEYYGLCAAKKIPIICHGSRGGMATHDVLSYYDNENLQRTSVTEKFKISWFTDHFVSPYAWTSVLERNPSLYLCLAHFGGDTFWDKKVNPLCGAYWQDLHDRDTKNWIAGFLFLMTKYPNFYVDMSYFLFDEPMVDFFIKALEFDPVVKERILFGTDWWLMTMENNYKKGHGYLHYVENFCKQVLSIKDKQALNKIGINDARELLAYFMTLNPMRFLQIKKHAPRLAEIYSQAKAVKENGWKFSLAEWINEVPENIEDFYK
jgi:predicted TIM-barrel fold metal-dependent hydrolase